MREPTADTQRQKGCKLKSYNLRASTLSKDRMMNMRRIEYTQNIYICVSLIVILLLDCCQNENRLFQALRAPDSVFGRRVAQFHEPKKMNTK